jgi:hypothetical protein
MEDTMISTKMRSMREICFKGALTLMVLVLPFVVSLAPANSQGLDTRPPTDLERMNITTTIETVFQGWAQLNLNLYMSAWSYNAHQHFKNGTQRDYNQILNSRRDAFKKYSRVDYSWTMIGCDIVGNKAYVACSYTMKFFRKNGSSFTENEDEYYTLEIMPDGRWLITENYDYMKIF